MKKIPNTFSPKFIGGPDNDGKFFTIRDLGEAVKHGAIQWKNIPKEYHASIHEYLNNKYLKPSLRKEDCK